MTPDTVLERAAELSVQIDSSGSTRISAGGQAIDCGPHGLAVLDEFSRPRAFAEALERLSVRVAGSQDWMDLAAVIVGLCEAGVLLETKASKPALRADGVGFGAAPVHVAMLNDRARTSSFLAGIKEVVRPGDVVVDIGTGTGVLAVAAAQAGARHVYAIEASGIGRFAQGVFAANGLTDRITLVDGWSTQVSLPERADVLISEIIGNEPLGERVLEATRDARRRHLKPGARFVPAGLQVFGLPVTIPDREVERHVFVRNALENWRAWYRMELGSLGDIPRSNQSFLVRPHVPQDWTILSEPLLLAQVDFEAVSDLRIDNTVATHATSRGSLNGLLIYFELTLGATTRFSTHPSLVNPDSSWRSMAWIVADPIDVQLGDRFAVTYQHRVGPARVSVARLALR